MKRFTLAVAITFAFFVAGCGSGDSSKRDEGAATSGVTADATGSAGSQNAAAPAVSAAVARASAAAGAAQGGTVDPCGVVTKEELEAALGFPLNPGQRGSSVGAECGYKSPRDPNPGTMPTVTVTIYRSRNASITYDELRKNASSRAADVPGLGEKAYVSIGSLSIDNRVIEVLQRDVLFSINVTAIINPPANMSDEEKRAKLIALARTALERL